MQLRQAVGDGRVGDHGIGKARRRHVPSSDFRHSGSDYVLADVDHPVPVITVARRGTAIVRHVGIDDDDASRNRRPCLAAGLEGVCPRFDDAERVALVGMSSIAVGAGVRAQEIDAAEPIKSPIAKRHAPPER